MAVSRSAPLCRDSATGKAIPCIGEEKGKRVDDSRTYNGDSSPQQRTEAAPYGATLPGSVFVRPSDAASASPAPEGISAGSDTRTEAPPLRRAAVRLTRNNLPFRITGRRTALSATDSLMPEADRQRCVDVALPKQTSSFAMIRCRPNRRSMSGPHRMERYVASLWSLAPTATMSPG